MTAPTRQPSGVIAPIALARESFSFTLEFSDPRPQFMHFFLEPFNPQFGRLALGGDTF